jgi:hypothetical protein
MINSADAKWASHWRQVSFVVAMSFNHNNADVLSERYFTIDNKLN